MRSNERTDADAGFQQYQQEVKAFTATRKSKQLSLNKEERLARQEKEKAWIRKIQVGGNASRMLDDDEKEESPTDFILEEGLKVLSDLIFLQSGNTL